MSSAETYTILPTKKYKCETWSTEIPYEGIRTVSATFIRVFEP